MITEVVNLVGDGAGDWEKRGREVYGRPEKREGGKQEKVREKVGEGGRRWWEAGEKGKIMQHCAVSLNTKNAKRRKPTNTGGNRD